MQVRRLYGKVGEDARKKGCQFRAGARAIEKKENDEEGDEDLMNGEVECCVA